MVSIECDALRKKSTGHRSLPLLPEALVENVTESRAVPLDACPWRSTPDPSWDLESLSQLASGLQSPGSALPKLRRTVWTQGESICSRVEIVFQSMGFAMSVGLLFEQCLWLLQKVFGSLRAFWCVSTVRPEAN